MRASSLCGRSMGATRNVWDDADWIFDDSLIVFATSVYIAWVLAMEREGNPKTKPIVMTYPLLATFYFEI